MNGYANRETRVGTLNVLFWHDLTIFRNEEKSITGLYLIYFEYVVNAIYLFNFEVVSFDIQFTKVRLHYPFFFVELNYGV